MDITRRKLLGTAVAGFAAGPGIVTADRNGGTGATRFGVSRKRLMLTHTWTISRNSSDFKDNVFVRIERDGVVGWGEAAPNVRYGESAEQTIEAMEKARSLIDDARLACSTWICGSSGSGTCRGSRVPVRRSIWRSWTGWAGS